MPPSQEPSSTPAQTAVASVDVPPVSSPEKVAATISPATAPRFRFRRRTLSRLVFESILIVFSVLLALTLNEVRMHYASRSEHIETLRNLRTEIERNSDIVAQRYLPLHTRILEKLESIATQPEQLAALKKTGLNHVDLLPNESWIPEFLHDTAWKVASASGSVLSYDERFALTPVYSAQSDAVRQTMFRLQDVLMSEDFSDPVRAEPKLRQLQIVMRELVSQERSLLTHTYRDALANNALWAALEPATRTPAASIQK